MNTCPSCSYNNPLGANFCASCGHVLSETVAATETQQLESISQVVSTTSTQAQAMLVVRQGSKRGSRIALDADLITVGRHPESDIFLDDVTVSRQHAEIARSGTSFSVSDMGSLNGTYVNKVRIESAELTDGCELQIGKFKMVFLFLEDDQ